MAQWGHVAKDNFPSGEEGVKKVKEELAAVKGTLVEMPLESWSIRTYRLRTRDTTSSRGKGMCRAAELMYLIEQL
jgi:hypothetical protein